MKINKNLFRRRDVNFTVLVPNKGDVVRKALRFGRITKQGHGLSLNAQRSYGGLGDFQLVQLRFVRMCFCCESGKKC